MRNVELQMKHSSLYAHHVMEMNSPLSLLSTAGFSSTISSSSIEEVSFFSSSTSSFSSSNRCFSSDMTRLPTPKHGINRFALSLHSHCTLFAAHTQHCVCAANKVTINDLTLCCYLEHKVNEHDHSRYYGSALSLYRDDQL